MDPPATIPAIKVARACKIGIDIAPALVGAVRLRVAVVEIGVQIPDLIAWTTHLGNGGRVDPIQDAWMEVPR